MTTLLRRAVPVAVLLAAASAGALAQTADMEFRTVAIGEISGFRFSDNHFAGAELVIDNRRAWHEFWERHTAGRDPRPPLPDIDFQHRVVIAVLLGIQTSGGGPFIEVRNVWNVRGHGLRVLTIEDETPGPLDVITNPFHIIAVRKPRHLGPVSFLHEER